MVRGNGLSVNLGQRWGRKSLENGRIWCWRDSRIRCAIDDTLMRETSISLSPFRFVLALSFPLSPSRSSSPSSGVWSPLPPSNVTSTVHLWCLPVCARRRLSWARLRGTPVPSVLFPPYSRPVLRVSNFEFSRNSLRCPGW